MVGQKVMWLDIPLRSGRRLLDVGCGNGQFLARMRKIGWEVIGVELDKQAVDVARDMLGIYVYHGSLEEAKFSEDSFDAITMHHVIEHLFDPIGTLKECHRLLKPGGKLVVVTPNIDSLGHKLFKEAWRGLEPPRHLYIFSTNNIKICARRAGFQVVKIRTTARSARRIRAASLIIRREGVLPGGSSPRQSFLGRLQGLLFQLVEYGISQIRDIGEEIILVATKR